MLNTQFYQTITSYYQFSPTPPIISKSFPSHGMQMITRRYFARDMSLYLSAGKRCLINVITSDILLRRSCSFSVGTLLNTRTHRNRYDINILKRRSRSTPPTCPILTPGIIYDSICDWRYQQ